MNPLADVVASLGFRRRMTAAEAIKLGCCKSCRRDDWRDWNEDDQYDWFLCGLCPTCFRERVRSLSRIEDGCE